MNTISMTDSVDHDSPGVNLMPPMVFYTCLIVGGLLEFLFPQDFPLFSAPIRIGLGLIVGGAGFAFMGVAHEAFKRIGTNVPTNLPATAFVAHGAYRFSRNPMYVGGFAFFLGLGLVAGSLWMVFSSAILVLYLSVYVIPREEAYMERMFGDDYREYRRRVRRWL